MPEIKTAGNKIKKGDFIELDFSAYTGDGMLFDTTREEDAKKAGIDVKDRKFEPLTICVGEGMLLRGLDREIENKEIGKDYDILLKPEHAFGKRDVRLIKTVPLSAFTEMPHAGMMVNVNGMIARVVSVTSGRALIDLNNPLAGKEVIYKIQVRAIVHDNKKKISAIARMFGTDIENFEEKEGKAIASLKRQKSVNKGDIELLKKKTKELANLDLEVK